MSVDGSLAVPEFAPSRAIVLSELSVREKDKYYDLLLRNNSKFYYDPVLKKFVGNVRLLGPNVKRYHFSEKKKMTTTALPFEERLKRLHDGVTATVNIQGVPKFEYDEFTKIVALIASDREVVKPKKRTLSWMMRTIEELYDARFAFEKIDVERDAEDDNLLQETNMKYDANDPKTMATLAKRNAVSMFPAFVVRRLCTWVGLKSLVDQTCWDILYNIHLYRHDYLEIELFARFLKEHYDYDDLLFFLYVRSVIAKTLNINFKGRWACNTELDVSTGAANHIPATLYLSYRECMFIANIVYGSQGNEAIYKRFIAMVTTQLVGQTTATTDSRRIDVAQFLHLAVIGYHYAQNMMNMSTAPAATGAASGSSGRASGGDGISDNNMMTNVKADSRGSGEESRSGNTDSNRTTAAFADDKSTQILFPEYQKLYDSAYKYIEWGNHDDTNITVESLAANIIVEITLRKAAAAHGITVEELKQLPVGPRRRNIHDDTTVVVMYL